MADKTEYLSAIRTKLDNAFFPKALKQKSAFWILYASFFSQQEQRLKELAKKPHSSLTTAASPVSSSAGGIMTAPAIDIFSTPSSSNRYVEEIKITFEYLDLKVDFS